MRSNVEADSLYLSHAYISTLILSAKILQREDIPVPLVLIINKECVHKTSMYLLPVFSLSISFCTGNKLSPCSVSNGNCSHLCLLSSIHPAGYSCSCPQGMVLSTDQRTCYNITLTMPPVTLPMEGMHVNVNLLVYVCVFTMCRSM